MIASVTIYLWIGVHIGGAVLMLWGWRHFRQRFFGWSAAKWACQAASGAAYGLMGHQADTLTMSAIRVAVTVTGCAALLYSWRMLRSRGQFVEVVAATSSDVLIRDGMQSYALKVEPHNVPEDDEDTPVFRRTDA